MSEPRQCAHTKCHRTLPDWAPQTKHYCNANCKAAARLERLGGGAERKRKELKKKEEIMFGTDEDYKVPEVPEESVEEMDEAPSPYAAKVDMMEEDRHADREERLATEPPPKKRGRKSWQEKTQRFQKNMFRIDGLVDGRIATDPTGYYAWVARRNVEQDLQSGYRFASRRRLGLDQVDNLVGISRGTHPDQIWVNEMVLMRRPLQHHLDEVRYHQLLTEAQTVDLEKAADRMGLVDAKPRHGAFGMDRIKAYSRRSSEED